MTFQKILKKRNNDLKLIKFLSKKDTQKINKYWDLDNLYSAKQHLKYFLTIVLQKFGIKFNFNSQRQLINVEKKYDKIAGSYIKRWNSQKKSYIGYWKPNRVAEISGLHFYSSVNIISEIIKIKKIKSFLEVGAGEMTTLCGILKKISQKKEKSVGAIDISLKRLVKGQKYLVDNNVKVDFVARADVTELPFEDNTFELIYSNYCFEQCPQLFEQGLREMIRVCKRYIIMIEPSYEFSEKSSKNKIISKGYIRLNKRMIKSFSTNIVLREPMPYSRYINRGEIIILSKKKIKPHYSTSVNFASPFTKILLEKKKNFYYSPKEKIKFPIKRKSNIAMLAKFDAIKINK